MGLKDDYQGVRRAAMKLCKGRNVPLEKGLEDDDMTVKRNAMSVLLDYCEQDDGFEKVLPRKISDEIELNM